MLDKRYVEKNYRVVKRMLAARGYILKPELIRMYRQVRLLDTEIQDIQRELNIHGGNHELKNKLRQLKEERIALAEKCELAWHMVPNLCHVTTPAGQDANDNKVIEQHGTMEENKNDYLETGILNGLDTTTGTVLACPRFAVYRGKVAMLHRKLLNMALDHYIADGYEYAYVPNLVNKDCMTGTGQLPKFNEEIYKTDELLLIPTGEVPLTNLYRDTTLKNITDIKLVTNTPCFRKEAGAAGKDTKGVIRQHQFEKVELVRICHPDKGLACLNEMVATICKFVNTLGITYRVVELCTGDIGFAGHKAYDIEVWFPGERRWREIATITWCHDFQARRMRTYVRDANGKQFAHTLNGTGLAVGRVMACMLETFGEDVFNTLHT